MLHRTLLVGVALMMAGCTVGRSANDIAPVTTGGGIQLNLELWRVSSWPGGSPTRTPFQQIVGELLHIDDAGLLVNGPAIVRLDYTAIRKAEFENFPKLNFTQTGPSATQLEELKLYSRYSTPIDNDLMAVLLQAYTQDSLYVFR